MNVFKQNAENVPTYQNKNATKNQNNKTQTKPYTSSYSSRAITFTFGQIPLGKL